MLYEGVNISTNQRVKSYTIQAPTGGLNGRDSLAAMAEKDAYELTNIFPGNASCGVREGCTIHQPPLGNPVSSLEVYASGEQQTILAFVGDKVFDVTVAGVSTDLGVDINSPEVVATMFSTVADGAQFLIITTGGDVPMSFDGAALADLAITGTLEPVEGINYVQSYMGRLFFGMEDRLGFYYLPPGQIQGAAEWFDLGQASTMGGYLQAIATYSDDSGDGPADYIVFVSSRGEYFMFRGIDPGDANSWEIVGRFRGAEPIGRKCVLDYSGDVLILTTEGVHQFSQIRRLGDTRFEAIALSSKLGDLLLKHNVNRDIWGWNFQLWPLRGMLIVNAPDSNNPFGEYHQFVMNTNTQAWTKFSSREWDAVCWCMSNKRLFFGRYDGSVREVGGLFDNGKPIRFSAKQAYNYFNTMAYKQFKWAQFLVRSDAPVVLSSRLSVDYKENTPVAVPSALNAGDGAKWDVAFWDDGMWGYGLYTQRWIESYGDFGVVASHWLIGELNGAVLEWFSTEHVFEPAEGLL